MAEPFVFGNVLRRIVALALLLAPLGLAQTPYVLRHFDLEDLASVPGEVTITTDYQTILEFEDFNIVDVTSARLNLITAEPQDNVVRVRANQEVINTDLTVFLEGGRTAMFLLRSDPRLTSQLRYVVRNPPPPVPITGLREGREGIARRQALPASSTRLPAGLTFDATVFYVRGGELVVQYALGNAGENPIANDPGRLELVQGDGKVPYTLSRVAPRGSLNRIFPNEAEYGTIVVTDPPSGTITLRWPLVEIGPGRAHLLTRELNEGLTREVLR